MKQYFKSNKMNPNMPLELNNLDEINYDTVFGLPMTPSEWIGNVKYYPVIRINIDHDETRLILGDAKTFDAINNEGKNGKLVKITNIDGSTDYINTAYVKSATLLKIVERTLRSNNSNFVTGDYKCRWLIQEDAKATFINKYKSNY